MAAQASDPAGNAPSPVPGQGIWCHGQGMRSLIRYRGLGGSLTKLTWQDSCWLGDAWRAKDRAQGRGLEVKRVQRSPSKVWSGESLSRFIGQRILMRGEFFLYLLMCSICAPLLEQ